MKQLLSIVLLFILLPITSFAADVNITTSGGAGDVTVTVIPLKTLEQNSKPITVKRFLETAFTLLAEKEQIPDTYKYISLKFVGVQPGSSLYTALQKGVYMNFIENEKISLPLAKTATEGMLAQLVKRISGDLLKYTKDRPISIDTVNNTLEALYKDGETQAQDNFSSDARYPVVQDVFNRIQSEFYDANKVSSENLVQ